MHSSHDGYDDGDDDGYDDDDDDGYDDDDDDDGGRSPAMMETMMMMVMKRLI